MTRWIGLSLAMAAGLAVLASPVRADPRDGRGGWDRRDDGGRGQAWMERDRDGWDRGPARMLDRDGRGPARDRDKCEMPGKGFGREDIKRDGFGRDGLSRDGFGRGQFRGREGFGRRSRGARHPLLERCSEMCSQFCQRMQQRRNEGPRAGRRPAVRGREEAGRGLGEFRDRGPREAPPMADRQARLRELADRMRPLLNDEQKRKLDELLKAGQPARPGARPEMPRREGMRPEAREGEPRRPEMMRPEMMRPEMRRPEGDQTSKPDARGQYRRGPDGQWRFERGPVDSESRRPGGKDRIGQKVQELIENYQRAVRNAGPDERAELQKKLVRQVRELCED